MFDNLWYLVAAFAVVWAGVFGYLAYMSLLARGIRREVETLAEVIASGSSALGESARPTEESEAPPAPLQPLLPEEQAR